MEVCHVFILPTPDGRKSQLAIQREVDLQIEAIIRESDSRMNRFTNEFNTRLASVFYRKILMDIDFNERLDVENFKGMIRENYGRKNIFEQVWPIVLRIKDRLGNVEEYEEVYLGEKRLFWRRFEAL